MSTVKLDSKRRMVVPNGKPGEIYDVQKMDDGQLLLMRLEKPEPTSIGDQKSCLAAMADHPLRPTMGWDELKSRTREP